MATFLDISGLQGFSNIFAFLFVFLVVYGVLAATKVFSDNKTLYLLLALLFAIFTLLSPIAIGVVEYISPWIAIITLFVVFLVIASQMFGYSGMDGLGDSKIAIFVVLILIVVVGALGYIRDQVKAPGDEGGDADFSKTGTVLLHPKILGAVFVLIISIFTVVLLAGRAPLMGGHH
ncbi:hypothetical protein HYU13_01110 [Candidatus Woesearchaeota archaeon]|nr:hypothetical protein [Candidatus Woesearchaeota archaeon]